MVETLLLRTKPVGNRSLSFRNDHSKLVLAFIQAQSIIIALERGIIHKCQQYFSLKSKINFNAFHNFKSGL